MSVVARQPIWAVDIEAVNSSCCCHISKTLQGRANEGRSTVAIVNKLQLRREQQSLRSNTCAQIGNLTLNRSGFALLLRGDTGVQSHLDCAHWAFLSFSACIGSWLHCACDGVEPIRLCTLGTRQA